MNIVLIGSGNVASVLGRLMTKAGHVITQVYSRKLENAGILADELGMHSKSEISFTNNISSLDLTASLYLLSISDGSLQHIGDWLKLDQQLIVHTAGGVSKNILQNVSANYGVLYPLQSLHKEMNRIPRIPFLVDGNSANTISWLYQMAKQLSPDVEIADDEMRLKLHLGAIVVNNFTNHLFSLAEAYCIKEKISFPMLMPLISEVADRLQYDSPKHLQTGPAIRRDQQTIEKHKQILQLHPQLITVYSVLTKSIQEFYPAPGTADQ